MAGSGKLFLRVVAAKLSDRRNLDIARESRILPTRIGPNQFREQEMGRDYDSRADNSRHTDPQAGFDSPE